MTLGYKEASKGHIEEEEIIEENCLPSPIIYQTLRQQKDQLGKFCKNT